MAARRLSDSADWTEQDLAYAASIVLKIFRTYDVDNGGTLQIRELEHFLRRCGAHLTSEQITAIITQLDIDGDGEMNFAEFMAFLGRLYQLQFYGTDAGPPMPRRRGSNASNQSGKSTPRSMTPTQQPNQASMRSVQNARQSPQSGMQRQGQPGQSSVPQRPRQGYRNMPQNSAQPPQSMYPGAQERSMSPVQGQGRSMSPIQNQDARSRSMSPVQSQVPQGRSMSPMQNPFTQGRNMSPMQNPGPQGRSMQNPGAQDRNMAPVYSTGAQQRNMPQQGRNVGPQSRNTPPAVPPQLHNQPIAVQGPNPPSRYR